jgi:transposase
MKVGTDTPRKVSRRRYATDFKRRLVRMSLAPGASAAQIALKHQINTNLLFKWRQHYLREMAGMPAEPVKLLPVMVSEHTDVPLEGALKAVNSARSPRQTRCSGTIEIELSDACIRVKGAVDAELLRAVLQMVRSQ